MTKSMDQFSFTPAWKVASLIREGKISSQDFTRHIFERIRKYNPVLNAVIATMEKSAMQRAKEADDAVKEGIIWGPLHGVPVTVKDQFEIEGLVTTGGMKEYADYVPKTDATIVKRLKKAGAVIIGHTNVPVRIADWQTYNEKYGVTVNPWNRNRTPGGSSGGCGAAVASGLSYLSIGSDFAGSIRVPAHFCGVYGHRPSIGVVPYRGSVPDTMDGVLKPSPDMATPGPIARDPKDLLVALKAIGGVYGDTARAFTWNLPKARINRFEELRLGYIIDDPHCPLTSQVKDVLEHTINTVKESVAKVVEGWPKEVNPEEQYELFKYLRFFAKAEQMEDETETRRVARKNGSLQARAWTDPHKIYLELEERRNQARCAWANFFEEYDAFIMPVDFVAAFPHDHSEPMAERMLEDGKRRYIDQLFWISFGSLTGLPCTVAPVGFTRDGLPVGVQIIGPFMEDATPIKVAELIGTITGGYMPPSGFD